MTLGFSTHHPHSGQPTHFEQKILLPYKPGLGLQYPDMLPKIHTFRRGNRWRAGLKMHMVTGNRSPQRRQFNYGIPELEYCRGVQECIIRTVNIPHPVISVEVEGREIDATLFQVNDGFDSAQAFFDWFAHPSKPAGHVGQIVHWTEFRY